MSHLVKKNLQCSG